MAERRMFSKSITGTDFFLEMPQSTQLLYFHLSMNGDDDGFVGNPKTIMRSVGSKDDDMKLLIAKEFVIPFESGVIVIKDWKIHNYIRSDRYNETKYLTEKSLLELDENNSYQLKESGIPIDYQLVDNRDTQVRLGKDRLDQVSINKSIKPRNQIPPSLEEVTKYCAERKNNIEPQYFIDYYNANGWMRGKTKIKDWQATIRTWEINSGGGQTGRKQSNRFNTGFSSGKDRIGQSEFSEYDQIS